jgi:septum formation protein
VLALDGEIHGKPASAEEAVARWRRMRGSTGVLHTGHCVLDLDTGLRVTGCGATTVRFAEVSDAEIAAYVATGEPLEVAGAFTLDGLGGAFVTGVEGDPHNVVGISLPLLRELLAELGHAWTDFWVAQDR